MPEDRSHDHIDERGGNDAADIRVAPDQESRDSAQDQASAEQAAQIKKLNRKVFFALIGAAFGPAIALLGLVFAGLQWKVGNDQLGVMREQLRDAQSGAVEQQRNTERALRIAEDQARSMKLSAESSRSNERGRLFVQNIALSTPGMIPQAGERVKVVVEIANSGRSAAKHVASSFVVEAIPAGSDPIQPRVRFAGDYTVPPNVGGVAVEMTLELKRSGRTVGPLSPQMADAIMKSRTAIVLHGRITYRDIFDEPHWVEVCRVWKPDEVNGLTGGQGGWRDCSQGRRTDDDQPPEATPRKGGAPGADGQ